MLSISLPSDCVLFRAAFQSLIGRTARYTPSSGFEMHLLNSTQSDGNYLEHPLIGICMPFRVLRQTSYDELSADGGRLFCQKRKLR